MKHPSIFSAFDTLTIAGAPGTGKNEFAKNLHKELEGFRDIVDITVGDDVRSEMHNKTDLGLKMKSYTNKGNLVPDELINPMVEARIDDWITHNRSALAKIDGFPRNGEQTKEHARLVAKYGLRNVAVFLEAEDEEELIRRMLARAHGEGKDRGDNAVEVLRHRLKVAKVGMPEVKDYLGERGELVVVNSLQKPLQVFHDACIGILQLHTEVKSEGAA